MYLPSRAIDSGKYKNGIYTVLQIPLIYKEPPGIIEQLGFKVKDSKRIWSKETSGD